MSSLLSDMHKNCVSDSLSSPFNMKSPILSNCALHIVLLQTLEELCVYDLELGQVKGMTMEMKSALSLKKGEPMVPQWILKSCCDAEICCNATVKSPINDKFLKMDKSPD